MAVHVIEVIDTMSRQYRFVQYDWSTELRVVDRATGDVVDGYASVALPTEVRPGAGFTVEVLPGSGLDRVRPVVVVEPVVAVAEIRLDPTKPVPDDHRHLVDLALAW